MKSKITRPLSPLLAENVRRDALEEAARIADLMAEKWAVVSLKGVHGCQSVAREIRARITIPNGNA